MFGSKKNKSKKKSSKFLFWRKKEDSLNLKDNGDNDQRDVKDYLNNENVNPSLSECESVNHSFESDSVNQLEDSTYKSELVSENEITKTTVDQQDFKPSLTNQSLCDVNEQLEGNRQVDTFAQSQNSLEKAPVEVEKKGFFNRIKNSLIKTRSLLVDGVANLFYGKEINEELLEELENQLLIADVGIEATNQIIQSLTNSVNRKELRDGRMLLQRLKEELHKIIESIDNDLLIDKKITPFVILVVGVNGVGKTTTIGKIAKQLKQQGKSVMLAAGDTFRAAAVEQLKTWGERNKINVIAQPTGSDSASVIYDAFSAAKARQVDVLIADTAGRLHNKDNLMQELQKISRVLKKMDPHAPHETLLVLDAGTGQNAINQVDLFKKAVDVSGLALTKLDGTAKGGVLFALSKRFGLPVRYLGVGEQLEDLRPFDAKQFIDALFSSSDLE